MSVICRSRSIPHFTPYSQATGMRSSRAAPPRLMAPQACRAAAAQPSEDKSATCTPPSPQAPLKISGANRWVPPVSRFAPTCTRELAKTTRIARSSEPVALPYAEAPLDLDRIKAAAGGPSLRQLLAAGTHDGFLVLHKGKIAAEHVTGNFDARRDTHAMNSASKVAVACIAGMLAEEGKLDLKAPLEVYVPEARDNGYRGVTVQQALDMQSGVVLDPYDEFYALGMHPQQGDHEAIGIYNLAMTRQQPPGPQQPPHYRPNCTDTDMVGFACEKVSGQSYKDLLTSLWQSIGAQEDADFVVDDYRTPVYNGGLVPTLHDLGRFGLMLANGGRVGDRQVVPAAFLDDSRKLTPALQDAYKTDFYGNPWPGVAYHNTFFVDARRPGMTVNYGAFGNLLVVDPQHHMVGVLLSAWPKPNDGVMNWINAFSSIADALGETA